MKMRKILPALLAVIALAVTACASGGEPEEGEPFIYCINEEKTGIVKVEYELPGGEPLEAAEQMLKDLQEPLGDIGHSSAIPEEVDVRGCELSGSILEIDFSQEYLEVGRLREKLLRASVVQSLVQIDGINGVAFTIGGKPLTDGDGMIVGLMNEDDFVGNTSSSPSSYQTDDLRLYFANESGDGLVSQTVNVRYSSNVPKDKLIVEKLMQGPDGEGAYPTINPDATLLSVTTKDGICYVNFDSTFLTGAYDILPELTIYSIVNSLIEGTEAVQVQITINGESNAEYMEAVDLSRPLAENMDLVAADEEDE